MSLPDNDRIADPLDRAAAESENMLSAALSVRKPTGPVANGECHFCFALVADGHRWCDADCRDSWEKEQKLEGRE